MQANQRNPGRGGPTGESPAALDRRISEVEAALKYSREFLQQLAIEDQEVHHRIEEITYSYERELDRLRSKKNPPKTQQSP